MKTTDGDCEIDLQPFVGGVLEVIGTDYHFIGEIISFEEIVIEPIPPGKEQPPCPAFTVKVRARCRNVATIEGEAFILHRSAVTPETTMAPGDKTLTLVFKWSGETPKPEELFSASSVNVDREILKFYAPGQERTKWYRGKVEEKR